MAEHDEKLFEHEFEEKLRKLDANIKIPEIPDAQSIFEKVENEKNNVVPFKKYSRYVAAAAAVVLICVAVPLFSSATEAEFLEQKSIKSPNFIFNTTLADSAAEMEAEMEPETVEELEAFPEESYMADDSDGIISESSKNEGTNSSIESIDGIDKQGNESTSKTENTLEEMLFEFFNSGVSEEIKESSAVSSSDANPSTGGAGTNPEVGGVGDSERNLRVEYGENGEISILSEKINKKRSIEIVVENGFVSARIFDTFTNNEIISAFWVEGKYESTWPGENFYTIYLSKKITEEDFEAGNYIPMAGDAVNGTYSISDNNISLPRKVIYGEFYIIVEIDLKTGEYEIYANLR